MTMAPPAVAESGRISARDDRILAALLDGSSQRKAAELAGTSERTVRRRVADPGFQRRLQEAQEEAIKRVRRRATASAEHAIDALVAIARNYDGAAEAEGASARSMAARAILQAFVQLQPRHLSADVESTSTVRYVIDGVDLEALR